MRDAYGVLRDDLDREGCYDDKRYRGLLGMLRLLSRCPKTPGTTASARGEFTPKGSPFLRLRAVLIRGSNRRPGFRASTAWYIPDGFYPVPT